MEDVNFEAVKTTGDDLHLKFQLVKDNKIFSVIGFWMQPFVDKLKDNGQKIDVLFSLERGFYDQIQIVLKDIKLINLDW